MRPLHAPFATFAFASALLLAVPAPAAAQPARQWTVDSSHSSAQFAVRHMMISTVRGQLGRVSGTVLFDGGDVSTVSADISIDVNGINTREQKRDDHLRSADFFDAQNHPAITFKSKKSEPAGNGRFRLIGDLTLRGVTREVVLDVEGPSPEVKQGSTHRVGATATTRINRSDYGLLWNRAVETGGVVVGDEVSITIDVQLLRKVATSD
jgi:polyisoprenoid-binding protein YceI